MNDPFEAYQDASDALEDYDQNAGQPDFDLDESNRLEQEKHDASQNVSAWTRFWNP